jgi:hypothetical protein
MSPCSIRRRRGSSPRPPGGGRGPPPRPPGAAGGGGRPGPPARGGGGDPADRGDGGSSPDLLSLANQLWLPAIIATYAIAFWIAISDLPGEAANYPRMVIVALMTFLVAGLLIDGGRWRRGAFEKVEDSDLPDEAAVRTRGPVAVWQRWHKTILAFLLTAAFVYAIPRVGFYESAAVFLLLLFYTLGIRRPLVLLPLTVGVMVGAWLLFAVALNVRIPTGPLIG